MCEIVPRNNDTVVILLDEDDLEWAAEMGWSVYKIRGKWYARNEDNQYLHRLIAGVTKRLDEVDHINGDSLDNRRGNLRVVTHKQNQQNRAYGYGKVGLRGVVITKSGRFVAQVKVDGKGHYLGTYATQEEAAEAALQGRLRLMTHSDPEARGITVLKKAPVEYAV